ncbi:MAG: pyridoxamine 5'-phosphate oxidase [Robiginitomaculum sp.]|nr:MAG: pyridoxamine 5'-phosphate oxidase [Robiginitomaculum sp.]
MKQSPKKPASEIYEDQAKANSAPMFRSGDPYVLFSAWMDEAKAGEPNDPNAMALATVDKDGLPDVRMVLLKGVDARGFVFYSHASSAKGGQLNHNPKAALNFHWKSLRRQVRVRGHVEPLSKIEVGKYFASRPRDSQLGAWASKQSKTMKTRGVFEAAIKNARDKFSGATIPLPPGWRGWRVEPTQIEFWRDRPFRLHDRLLFSWDDASKAWTKRRLYP